MQQRLGLRRLRAGKSNRSDESDRRLVKALNIYFLFFCGFDIK
jgi:hypothetical protein